MNSLPSSSSPSMCTSPSSRHHDGGRLSSNPSPPTSLVQMMPMMLNGAMNQTLGIGNNGVGNGNPRMESLHFILTNVLDLLDDDEEEDELLMEAYLHYQAQGEAHLGQ